MANDFRNGKNHTGNAGYTPKPVDNTGYVGAPYNFVSISKTVNRVKELTPHNLMDQDHQSGRICYEIEAVTPMMISAGKDSNNSGAAEQFYRNHEGKMTIPGSSVRGLVRGNVQILSRSSVANDIQDAVLMYRNVAGGKEKDQYNAVLGSKIQTMQGKNGKKPSTATVLTNVKAGYIHNTKGTYTIHPTVVKLIQKEFGAMNYYLLSERHIIENKYAGFEDLRSKVKLQHLNGPFQKTTDRSDRVHYKGQTNREYHPYAIPVFYQLKDLRKVTSVRVDKTGQGTAPNGFKNGYMVSTGPMQEKKVIYIIPELDETAEAIKISREDIDNFKRDYEGKKNQTEAFDKTYFNLPEEGKTKPVFYIELNGKLYFGFTPRLRLFYDKHIHDGLSKEQKQSIRPDYCQALFGFTTDSSSYKSRVSFLDAPTDAKNTEPETGMILGSPKPTSYLDYLESKEGTFAVSYNDDFQLRGVKQYWLKNKAEGSGQAKNDKVLSKFCPCKRGTVFHGEIRFENLSRSEVGMLLWGLLLEKNSEQNIGKGKAYGYGRIRIRLTGLEISNPEMLYGTDMFCLKPYMDKMAEKDEYIKSAKDEMTRLLGRDIMQEKGVKQLLLMKDATKVPEDDKTRYMKLGERKETKEYQERVKNLMLLPSPEDVIAGKPAVSGRAPRNNNGRNTGGNRNMSGYHGGGQNNRNGYGNSSKNGGQRKNW